jgi:protein SCO1/2
MKNSLTGIWLALVTLAVAAYGGFVTWRYVARTDTASQATIGVGTADRPIALEPVQRKLNLESIPMIERSGANFRFERLAGHVWVADVFFSSCPFECKMLTAQLRDLQNSFPDLKLLSVTCDPENDTPQRLRKYADENGAIQGRWFFVTGKIYDIHNLCRELFGEVPKELANGIGHSQRVALIDQEGRWHGTFDVFDHADMQTLRESIKALLASPQLAKPAAKPVPPEPPSNNE